MRIGEVFEEEGYFDIKKRILISIIILVIALIILLAYFLFFYTKQCKDETCYYNSIQNCKKVYFIRDDPQAVWQYRIMGNSANDACKVEVQLLKLKQGTTENENLIGKQMICSVYKTSQDYPEKLISECTGPLKEEMQTVIINRMHTYLLKNIGRINEEFKVM